MAEANSKAAKEAKSKESKEEREKREKYEKLMKKAEEMTTAKNYREALNLLGQAKAHANEAQLKGIEEKIQAVDKEMNKEASLTDGPATPTGTAAGSTEPYSTATAAGHAATTGLCPGPASSSKQATAKAGPNATAGKTGIRTASCTAGTTTVRVVDATATGTAAGTPTFTTGILTMLHKTPDPDRTCMECLRQREDGRMNPSCRRMNSSSLTSPILNNQPTIRKTTRIT